MKKLLVIFSVYVLSIACGNGNGPATAPVFDFDPPVNRPYNYYIVNHDYRFNEDGVDSTTQTTKIRLICRSKDDSLCHLQLVFTGLEMIVSMRKIKLQNGNMTIMAVPGKWDTLSSAQKPAEPLDILQVNDQSNVWKHIFYQATGDSLQVTMNRAGQVVNVKGYDAMVDKVTLALGLKAEIGHAVVNSTLREYLGTRAITDLLTKMFFYLPKRSIQPGDSWVNNVQLIAKAPVKYSEMMVVKDIWKDTVVLSTTAAISARAGEGGAVFADGKETGNVRAGYQTGMPYFCTIEENTVTQTDAKDIRQSSRTTIWVIPERGM